MNWALMLQLWGDWMKVPELRFPEFNKNWEEQKLEDIFKVRYGKDYKHLKEGHIPVLGTGGIMTYVDKYLYEKPSVLIGRKGTINQPIFIDKPFWTVDTLFYTEIFGADPKFTYYLALTINWLKYNEASGVPSLNVNNIKQIKVYIPSIKEQEKIISFMSKIDEKIEKLEKKEELWLIYKKGMMQQLFSQKLRFKYENGNDYPDWEEKKLSDISKLTSSKRVYLADYIKIGIPFYRGKEISNLRNGEPIEDLLYISESKYNEFKEKFGVPKKNDILITAVGTLGNVYRVTNNEPFYFKDGNLIWLKEVKENSYFLEYALEYNKKTILNSSIGSTQKALTIVELNKVKINIPTIPEQIKIANFISTIDKKIEQINKELKINKEFKKGLLQQMFPSDKKSGPIKTKDLSKLHDKQEEQSALL